jgi:ABC-type transporter Mla MlaB component
MPAHVRPIHIHHDPPTCARGGARRTPRSEIREDWPVVLSGLAARLAESPDLAGLLAGGAAAAEELLPSVRHAQITDLAGEPATSAEPVRPIRLVRPESPRSRLAASHRRADAGPGAAVRSTRRAVAVTDVAADHRWPAFRELALGAGFGSALSVPLAAGDRLLGVLHLYADEPGAFDDRDALVAGVLATHLTILVRAVTHRERLVRAVQRRDLIGQAKGVMMATADVDAVGAFDLLGRFSQRTNRKLHDVAGDVVEALTPAGKPAVGASLAGRVLTVDVSGLGGLDSDTLLLLGEVRDRVAATGVSLRLAGVDPEQRRTAQLVGLVLSTQVADPKGVGGEVSGGEVSGGEDVVACGRARWRRGS